MTTATLTRPAEPLTQVRGWRLEQLEHAGYPPYEAETLSRRVDIDLHIACSLLAAGCRVDTAMRILL